MTMLNPKHAGTGTQATGVITTGVASLLTFSKPCSFVVISNQSGAVAYFKVNDAASPLVSTSVYDFTLASGQTLVLNESISIKTLGVLVTSGAIIIGASGW